MARIKFLDVLEETRMKSAPREISRSERTETAPREEFRPSRRVEEQELGEMPIRRSTEQVIARDSSMAYDTTFTPRGASLDRKSMAPASHNHSLKIEDHKVLWTRVVFVLFGGVLFFSGYFLGKTVTSKVKEESAALLMQNQQTFRREEINNTINRTDIPNTIQPLATTLEAPKPIAVVEPTVIEAPKPVVKKAAPKPVAPAKSFVIQISAHSTIESARVVEDQLRNAGYTAYTSESIIGDAIFFRVRLRGFKDKKDAQDTLAQIKAKGLGTDGFVLSLE